MTMQIHHDIPQLDALIAAKPTDRRHLLEEAAGITGLHSRRHEAELRLKAAETNLGRLDDVLAAIDAARLNDELRRPLEWLRERFDRVLPWLTYPYGLFSAQVERTTEESGQFAAMRVDGGWLSPAASARERYRLPRLNIPSGVSLRGFELRTSGVRR